MPKKDNGLGQVFDDALETLGIGDDNYSKSRGRKGGKSKAKKTKKSSIK